MIQKKGNKVLSQFRFF